MLQNYLTVAFRNIYRNPVYSFINILGLAIGLVCTILISLWVRDELSYDQFHKNHDRISQVYLRSFTSGGIDAARSVPYPLIDELEANIPAIKNSVITNWGEGNLLSVNNKGVNLFGLSASEDFLKMFSFDVLEGDPNTALRDPGNIVITEKTAQTLFGKTNAMNQLIRVDAGVELKVSAILKDVPNQSTFQFDYVLPFSYYESTQYWVRESKVKWNNNSFQIYIELQKDSDAGATEKLMANMVQEHITSGPRRELFLHPMTKWHLETDIENGVFSGGQIEIIRIFGLIAILILVIACINFMNLATARSESRAREVGIRKTMGSVRFQLIRQFIGESIIVTALAFSIAICLTELILPFYNQLVQKSLYLPYREVWFWATTLGLVLLVGIMAGSYPALYLSGFSPVKVLKGQLFLQNKGVNPRRVLVVMQFWISITLIIGSVFLYQQLTHLQNREVGYDRKNLLLLWTTSEIENNYPAFKDALLQSGAVSSVTKSNSPITRIFSRNELQWPGMPVGTNQSFVTIATEYDYAKTHGIAMVLGRDFSPDFKSDSTAVVLNETAVALMGLKDPIGTEVSAPWIKATIIGVMKDVLMADPGRPIEPLVMFLNPTWSSTISIRLANEEDLQSSIATVGKVYSKFNPLQPFDYRFADQEFVTKFRGIALQQKIALLFASLAIAISALGLFGLAAFTTERRSREFGIRKVLGATSFNLIRMVASDFAALILISFFIATGTAWYLTEKLLSQYSYRIDINIWVFLLVGVFCLMFALLIVGSQALATANRNPADVLKQD